MHFGQTKQAPSSSVFIQSGTFGVYQNTCFQIMEKEANDLIAFVETK